MCNYVKHTSSIHSSKPPIASESIVPVSSKSPFLHSGLAGVTTIPTPPMPPAGTLQKRSTN